MAINKNLNKRLDITLPLSQTKWIDENAAKMGISKSKFISWILAKRINQIVDTLKVYEAPSQEIRNDLIERDIEKYNNMTDQEIDDLVRRAMKKK